MWSTNLMWASCSPLTPALCVTMTMSSWSPRPQQTQSSEIKLGLSSKTRLQWSSWLVLHLNNNKSLLKRSTLGSMISFNMILMTATEIYNTSQYLASCGSIGEFSFMKKRIIAIIFSCWIRFCKNLISFPKFLIRFDDDTVINFGQLSKDLAIVSYDYEYTTRSVYNKDRERGLFQPFGNLPHCATESEDLETPECSCIGEVGLWRGRVSRCRYFTE